MRKFINLFCRLLVMLAIVAPVAYTASLLSSQGVSIFTLDYWLTVAPVAMICGIAWGMLDDRLEKELW